MDPKKMTNLDPKLQEAYNRVMGSTLGTEKPADGKPATPSTTPSPAPAAPPMPTTATPAPMQKPSVSPSSPAAASTPQAASSPMGFVASATPAAKEKAKISSGLLWVAGFVFFVIYALFWVKFFNFQIPFLPL